jgi:phenylacetic acid degradation operon negative regulatory protein
MDTYRTFSVIDPELPQQLLPAGWLRQSVREVFVAVYDGLAEAADDHVRTVVTRHSAGRAPAIRAHTVAELQAGVRPDLAGDPDRDEARLR